MKGTRKRRQRKKNLFDEDDDEDNPDTTQQPLRNLKQLNSENVLYDAAKLEENEIYINKEEKKEEEFEDGENLHVSKNDKTKKMKKKKNLFSESDSDKEGKSKSDSEEEAEQYFIHEKKEKYSGSDNEDEDQQQCQIQYMVDKVQQRNKPSKQVNFQILINEEKTIQGRKKLFTTPLEPGYKASCYFKRHSSGFTQTYQLQSEDQRTMIFCQNQRGSIGANFYFSLTKEMDKKNPNYVGKLRGNASGSTYQLYDDGIQPNKNFDRREWRTSLAYIDYENNFMGMNGPRKFKTVLPNLDETKDFDCFKLAESENLTLFQPPKIRKFRNKEPRWNQRLKSYALNFGGRVKQASIKNFIMIQDFVETEDEPTAKNVLVFGKVDENTFSLQFTKPLSVLQAFGIAISQFDYKLNCQ